MNRKIAAVLLAATMLTTPAFAASVANSPTTPTAQTTTSDKVTQTSNKGLKKHGVYVRSSHGHKVRHAKHARPTHVKHASTASKRSPISASTKSDTKAVAGARVNAPVKN